MAEQELDRSEEATPFKRQEARKKGTVAKSQDVSAAIVAGAFLLSLTFFGQNMIQKELSLFRSVWLASSSWSLDTAQFAHALSAFVLQSVRILMPLWITLIAMVLLACAFQVGLVLSFEPLKPDWKRLNPVEGFKKLFSLRMLFEGLKTTLKFIVFIWVLYAAVKALWPKLLVLPLSNSGYLAQIIGEGVHSVLVKLLVALIVIAVIDWVYVRREFNKKLRMSRREIKDEIKRREGDPRIKAKLRELRMQFLQKAQSVGKVKNADVLIVNPQHLAIAIKYQREKMMAPLVLSKGAGDIALKMKEVARCSGVPIWENKPLARSLFTNVKIDDWVPETHYAAVAKALVWAFGVRYGKQNFVGRGE